MKPLINILSILSRWATTIGVAVTVLGGVTVAVPQVDDESLRREVERRYSVVPVRGGIVLMPRQRSADLRSIEIADGTIAINGIAVTGGELRERLADDADLVLRLSYLGSEDRRKLFFPADVTPAPPAPPAVTLGEDQAASPPPAPEPPPSSEDESRAAPRHRTNAKVRIGGGIDVPEDEIVSDAVVAIGGGVDVRGQVRGDVVAIGGGVRLGPRARVWGDVTAIGGRVRRDPGAQIVGDVNEIGFGPVVAGFKESPVWSGLRRGYPFVGPIHLLSTLLRIVLVGLLAALVWLVARTPVERVAHRAAAEPWKAGFVGLLAQVLAVPLLVFTVIILAISIIGIPLLLLVPFAVVAVLVGLLLGFTALAYAVGRWTERHFGWRVESGIAALIVGLALLWGPTVLGRFIGLAGPVAVFAGALLLAGFLVEYVAWTVGFGAVLMTRFGTRPVGPWRGESGSLGPPVSTDLSTAHPEA